MDAHLNDNMLRVLTFKLRAEPVKLGVPMFNNFKTLSGENNTDKWFGVSCFILFLYFFLPHIFEVLRNLTKDLANSCPCSPCLPVLVFYYLH